MPKDPAPAEEIATVVAAMERMRKAKFRPARAYGEYIDWCNAHKVKERISDESVRQWLGNRRPAHPGTFYDFAKDFMSRPTPGDPVAHLAWAMPRLFPSGDSDEHQKLGRLGGSFELIRRLWLPAGSEDCLRCIVSFKLDDKACWYNERETFTSEWPVDETYTGYTFLFGTSFWIIAHEAQRQSLKFLTIHECSPPLTTAVDRVHKCKGNLIAVNGRGPNYSHPFVLRRIDKTCKCEVLSKEQIKIVFRFDKESFDYLYHDYGI